jgi:tetratricopeptide (TPR) repeat protein
MPVVIAHIGVPSFAESGDYYYRIHTPCAALAGLDGVYTIEMVGAHREMANVMRHADVVVLNHFFNADFLPMIRKRKTERKLTVFEIADDFQHVPNYSPLYDTYQIPDTRQLIKRTAWYCDGLQFTSEGLEYQYGYLNPYHRTFPNQISIIPPERKPCGDKIRIGWGGSISHLEDVMAIAKYIIPFINNTPNVHFCFMGTEEIYQLFYNIPEGKKTNYGIGSIYDYHNFLKNIDIGIAPLSDTPFNRSRSDLKFCEYAVNGIVPVVSDISTYNTVEHGTTGYLFRDGKEMTAILADLAGNRDKIHTIGRQAREYIINNRLQSQHAAARLSFYAEGLERIAWSESDVPHKYWKRLTNIAGAKQNKRHLKLKNTDFETLLFGGSIYSAHAERQADAVRTLKMAADLCRADYRPYLYMIGLATDKIAVINEALKRNPESILSMVLLGDVLSAQGKKIEVLGCYQKAAEIFPEYDVPFQKVATLLETMGDLNSAREFQQVVAKMQIL